MRYLSLLIIVSSLLISCRGRAFNNPYDPDKDERGYEILSIIDMEGDLPSTSLFPGILSGLFMRGHFLSPLIILQGVK